LIRCVTKDFAHFTNPEADNLFWRHRFLLPACPKTWAQHREKSASAGEDEPDCTDQENYFG
jgi:hypothetical protein